MMTNNIPPPPPTMTNKILKNNTIENKHLHEKPKKKKAIPVAIKKLV